jgi:hypothetical protein
MLTVCAAVEIYKMKLALLEQQSRKNNSPVSIWGQTRSVAKLFGVNSRTVKYIWNRQTWGHATEHLWECESELHRSCSFGLKQVTKFYIPCIIRFFIFSAYMFISPRAKTLRLSPVATREKAVTLA